MAYLAINDLHVHYGDIEALQGISLSVEKGQIVKISKDKDGIVSRDVLTRNWTDWIDYWSVDFDFESKREIVRTQNLDTGAWEESWTGDYIFENEWQSFRTRKDRTLELTSVFHQCAPGRRAGSGYCPAPTT